MVGVVPAAGVSVRFESRWEDESREGRGMFKSTLGEGARMALAFVIPAFGASMASSANAGFVATFQSYGAGQYASSGYRASDTWDSTAALNLYSIRAYQHQFASATGDVRLTWCAEVYQGVTLGTTYDFAEVSVESVPTAPPGEMGFERAKIVRDLVARWIDPMTQLVIGEAADRAAKSAAFQLAVWEITHENFAASDASGMVGQMSLATGAFRSAPGDAVLIWYSAIRDSLGVDGFRSVAVGGLSNGQAQDQIYLIPGPSAAALLMLAGCFHRRRR